MEASYPTVMRLSVAVNGVRIGLLSSLREEMERELLPIRVLERNTPIQYRRGRTTYRLTLQRLVPELTDDVVQTLLEAERFTLAVSDGIRTVTYSGCEIAAMTLYTEAGTSRIETLELLAVKRS